MVYFILPFTMFHVLVSNVFIHDYMSIGDIEISKFKNFKPFLPIKQIKYTPGAHCNGQLSLELSSIRQSTDRLHNKKYSHLRNRTNIFHSWINVVMDNLIIALFPLPNDVFWYSKKNENQLLDLEAPLFERSLFEKNSEKKLRLLV